MLRDLLALATVPRSSLSSLVMLCLSSSFAEEKSLSTPDAVSVARRCLLGKFSVGWGRRYS